ncbi:hypothetical protein [Thiomicrorhabdus lithotrophica]|uniref:Uncharacterized protein n=1 Tax=Thiomicrorhabdus lithotrophica TaxID=2949997 RepID=A0ABY8C862_9GAMM|nr:hypothetical protein [Thiomicrorhabdus lithotrophica]WEJ62156.1 hypothetical protein NR989_09060 [Thiomicrorhabdus lithotrophica]
MDIEQAPFFEVFGEIVTVDGVEVTVIVEEQSDTEGAEFGHMDSTIYLTVKPEDKDKFLTDSQVVINGNTLNVFKEPVIGLDGIVEVYLEL